MAQLAPVRSETEPTPQSSPLRNRDRAYTYLHRRLHSNSTNTVGSKAGPSHLHRAKDYVQSAIELKPPISFEHVLRREKKGPSSSHPQRGEHLEVPDWRAEPAAITDPEARNQVKPEDVAKARAENERRGELLRERLQACEEIGIMSVRDLDAAYYSMLEKAATLRDAIGQLQTLIESTRALDEGFRDETDVLENEITTQLDALGPLDVHEKTIDGLVTRLRSARTKTLKLDDRLEAARGRVAGLEERQNTTEKKRRQQWQVTWALLSSFVVLLVLLLVAKSSPETVTAVFQGNILSTPIMETTRVAVLEDAVLQTSTTPNTPPVMFQDAGLSTSTIAAILATESMCLRDPFMSL